MSKLEQVRTLRRELQALVASGGVTMAQAAPMLSILARREAALEERQAA